MAESFKEAINHARLGKGPAIIEATCNRFRGHYEGDTDHYRTNQDKKEMMKKDPLYMYKEKLIASKISSKIELDKILKISKLNMLKILEKVRKQKMPSAKTAKDFIFSEA